MSYLIYSVCNSREQKDTDDFFLLITMVFIKENCNTNNRKIQMTIMYQLCGQVFSDGSSRYSYASRMRIM